MKGLLTGAWLLPVISAQIRPATTDAGNVADYLNSLEGNDNYVNDIANTPWDFSGAEPKYVDYGDDPFWFYGQQQQEGPGYEKRDPQGDALRQDERSPDSDDHRRKKCPKYCKDYDYSDDEDEDYEEGPKKKKKYVRPASGRRNAVLNSDDAETLDVNRAPAPGSLQGFDWPAPQDGPSGKDSNPLRGPDGPGPVEGEDGERKGKKVPRPKCPKWCRPRPSSTSSTSTSTRTWTRRPRPTRRPVTEYVTNTHTEYVDQPTTTFVTATSVQVDTVTVDPVKPTDNPNPGPEPNPGPGPGPDDGPTLAKVCPAQCNPSPLLNKCHPSTTCVTSTGVYPSSYYCMCRAGFRANTYNPKDFFRQFRVTDNPNTLAFVRVQEGLECNQQCGDSLCSEVIVRNQCL